MFKQEPKTQIPSFSHQTMRFFGSFFIELNFLLNILFYDYNIYIIKIILKDH